MKNLYILFTILILSITTVNAQQVYPVNATGTLIPPFSTVLSDYAGNKSQDLMYTLTLNDPIEPSRQVYFRLTVKHNFTAIYQTDPNFSTQPITLQQFQPEMITGSDLAPYLNVNALQAMSGTAVSNLLPEGFNQICLEVMDFQRRVPISREICVGGFFQKLDAPLLDLPTCGATANISTTQNLMFRWQPRHLGQPNAPASVQYIFKIVELQPGFTNPFDVFDLSPHIYQTTVLTPTLFYTDAEPQLQEGKTYAWRVQATDGSMANVFQNNGKSPVCTFTVTKNKTNPANNTPNNIIPSCGANLTSYGPITYSNPKSGLVAVGDAIKLGYFDMKITQLNSTGDSYSGEGTVHIPFLKAHVLVEFFDLKIDPKKQVYEVTKVSAKKDVNMGLNPNDLTARGLAAKVNQGNLLNQLNSMVNLQTAGGRKVSQRNDADLTAIGLPLIMDKNGMPSVVLLDLQFSATDAKLVAIGIDQSKPNKPLPLTGVNIPFTPHGIGQNQGLNLTNDYEYTLANGSIVKLLANQTNAKVDCNGFAGYDLRGMYIFDRNIVLPMTTNPTDKVAATFTGKGEKLTDFIADITQMPSFTIPTIKDYVFTLENGKLDLSNTKNPTNIDFPTVYTETKNNDWQGFSFEKIKVKMPNQWTFGNQTNTSNLEITTGQIVINDDGMYANLSQDNLVKLADGKVKDWNISVDKFELEIAKSKTGNSNITGEIKLPVLDDALTYKGDLTTNQNGDVNIEVKPTGINTKMSMWFAEMNFDSSAVAKIMTRNINNTKSFIPYGSLSGEINIEIDSATFAKSIIGNSTSKLTRLKQALDFPGDASLSVSNIFLDGFVIDPTNISSKRYILNNYEKSPVDLDVIIGNKNFAPNTIQVFYQPKTANEPNKLGLEIAVQNGANVVSIIVWAKQEANGQFVFSHIDTDSRLVDCDCTSLDDWKRYKGYGSRVTYNEDIMLASNDININEYRITADTFFTINAAKDKITIPYLKNMEISVELRGNQYLAKTTTFSGQNPDFIKRDAKSTASVSALDLSSFKIDDSYLQGLAAHMSKSSRNKLPIDLSGMFKEFLGKYDKTKYPFPANSHLILTGIKFDANLKAASGQVILVVKQDGKWITFANGDVLLKPKAVGFKTLNLYLTEDIKNTNVKMPFTFKKVLKNTPSEGSFAAIQCEGFKAFNIQSVYETDKLHAASLDGANAIVFDSTASAEIPFIIKGNDLQDFITEVDYAKAKPFVIGTDGGKMFTITKGFIDYNSQKNPVNTPVTNNDFKGIFLAEADMMVWGFMKKDGTTRKPLNVKATNILYSHADGITVTITMSNPVPVASKSDMDGWNYVLENLNFEIDKNAYTKQDVKGKIELPIVADGEFMNFDGQVGWDAAGQIPTATFNVDTVGKTDFSMPFLPAVSLMIESGTEVGFTFAKGNRRSEFAPNAKLNGKMGIKFSPSIPIYRDLPQTVKDVLPLEFVLGGIMFQDMKLNHPDDMNAAAGCIDNKGIVGGIKTFSVASFGIDTTSVLGDMVNNNPAYNAFKDKAAGALEGFPISIENVTFRCDKKKNGTKDAGGNPNYDDMFKLQFDIIVNLMPGEQESDVDASDSDATADQVDDSDDPIESIAGLFDEGGAAPAPASSKPKSTAGIAAAGQFGIWFKPEKDGNGGQDLVFDHISLDALKVDAKFSVLTMSGTLMCYNDDPIYGDGFKGHIKVDISKNSGGAMSGQAKGFQVLALAQFGTTDYNYKKAKSKDPYRYFFVDLEAVYKQGIGAKIALHGIGGGFFFNMAREDSKILEEEQEKELGKLIASGQQPKVPTKLPDEIDYTKSVLEGVDTVFYNPGATLSGYKYYPKKGAYGGYLKGIFSVAKRPDLASFDIAIGLELQKNSAGNLGLSKIFARGDLYVQGDADITLRKEAPGQGYVDITYDHINSALTCDFGFNFAFKRYINPLDTNSMVTQELIVTGTGGMLFSFKDPKKWYVKVGKPQLADRLSAEMKQNGLSLNTMRAYIQFGHDLDDIPKLHEVIPGWPADFDPQDKTRPDMSGGDGLMFGVNFQLIKFEKEFLMFKAYMEAGGGFDLKVAKYTGISCANTSDGSFGVNNWYAMGQAYAYMKAGVSMNIDIPLIYSGEVSLFEAMAAIALQAQLPNPSWMRGAFYGQFSVLNGLVEGECRFQFELGEKCQVKQSNDFLNKVELITDMSPDSASTNVPIFASAGAGFAIPQNRQFLVKSMDKNGKDIMRRFIPFIKEATLETTSGNTVNGTFTIAPDGYTLSFQPDDMLEAQTDYTFTVNMRWKEFLNNKWNELPQGETRVTKFKTGNKPNRIYAGMVGRMAPGEGQRYWHKNYAYAELVFKYNGMDYLFPKTSTELKSNSTMTQGMTNAAAIPNDIPLNYFIQLIEYDKNGNEQRTLRLPITKFPNAGNVKYIYNKQLYKSYANTNIKMPYMKSDTTTGMKLEFDQLNSVDLKKGYMYEFSIKREPSRSYMAINSSSTLQNVAIKDSMSSGSKISKKVTTVNSGNTGNAAIGDLYATYYTTYFAVSNYGSLNEKLNNKKKDDVSSTSGSNTYEYPSNVNLPSGSWAMGKGDLPIEYDVFKLGEPLDEYDRARLNINLKRLDLAANSNKDYFYEKKYKYAEGQQIVPLYTEYTQNGVDYKDPTNYVGYYKPTIHDYTMNWSDYYTASRIPAAVKACGGVKGTDAVRFENFMTNIMQPYYQKPEWAYRLVFNSGMENKGRISSVEEGSKKLNNNVQGTFPGVNGYYDYAFAIANLDGYILSVQAKMARTLAQLNFDKKCGQLNNYKSSLMYFLPENAGAPAGKTFYRPLIQVHKDRYQNRQASDFSDKYYAEYSYLYKWKSPLQDVSQSERTGKIVFKSYSATNYNPPVNNNNNGNTAVKIRSNSGSFILDYDDNSIAIEKITIRSKDKSKIHYHWDGATNESYEYIYDAKGYLVKTNNYFDMPATRNGRTLEGSYPNSDYTIDCVTRKDQWSSNFNTNTINSHAGNTVQLTYTPSGQIKNHDLLVFDYDFNKSQLNLSLKCTSHCSSQLTIYDVTNGENQRIVHVDVSSNNNIYDYRTQTEKKNISLIPGKTYHVYYRSGYRDYWVKLDNTFWTTNKGRLRVALNDLPLSSDGRTDLVDNCKRWRAKPESTPQFAYKFAGKGEQKAGESTATWNSKSDKKITDAFQKSNGFTIEAKIKPLKGTATIANFPNGSLKMIDGKLQMEMDGSSAIVANTAMTLDKWHHIAAIYSKNGNIVQFFIDGKQDKSATLSSTWTATSGDSFSGSGEMVLDDITIWKSVRTRQQLIQTATSKTPTITNDVVINYDFSNGIGSRALLDLSNNKLNGAIIGGDCYCDYEKSKYDAEAPIPVTVSYNYVLDFDGDEYVNVPNVTLSNSMFTLESYIKAKSVTKDGALISTNTITVLAKNNGAFTNKYNLAVTFQNNGKSETLTATTNLDINKWYHIAVIQDSIKNNKTTLRLLIDGVQVTMKKNIPVISLSNDFKIGGNGSANFDGQIDMVRLWNIPRKIVSISNSIRNDDDISGEDLSKLIVHYDFDVGGPGKSILNDRTSNTKDGTLTNMEANEDWVLSDRTPIPTSGGNFVMRFDGNQDYVEVQHNSKLNIGNNFAIEFWAKTNTSLSGQTWFIQKLNSYGVYVRDGNELSISTWGEDGNFGKHTYITDNDWHHYTITGENGKGLTLYIDGLSTKTISGNFAPNTGNQKLYIGSAPNGSAVNVMLENVMIWNKTLNAADAKKHYESPSTDTKDLALFYNFNSGNTKTVLGRSANRLNGVMSANMTSDDWQPLSGDFENGYAIDFDGNDDKLKATIPLTNKVTYEAWINVDNFHDVAPYAMHIMGYNGKDGIAAMRLVLIGGDRYLQGAFNVGTQQMVFHSKTPIKAKQWYKIKVQYDRGMAKLWVNDKEEVNKLFERDKKNNGGNYVHLTIDDLSAKTYPFTIGSSNSVDAFDGVIANIKLNDEHFKLQEGQGSATVKSQSLTLTMENMDKNIVWLPFNPIYGNPAIKYPNAGITKPTTTGNKVYTINDDKSLANHLSFNIPVNETITELSVNYSDGRPMFYWTETEGILVYKYVIKNGQTVLDKVEFVDYKIPVQCGSKFPIRLDDGIYNVEVKKNGQTLKATHTINSGTVFTDLK